jgi:serine/threonine-protein kinase
MLGEVFGNYRITGALSAGGMGAVYRAEHALIGKAAAVKVLLPEWSANTDVVNRFFNEARTTTAIRHPGIVEVFDFGHHASGRAYLVMELLDGEPLSDRLERVAHLDEAVAVGFVRSITSALTAAHAAGVIHRDLKPANIFLVRDPDVPGGERPKLLDFGIAKLADGRPASVGMTQTGMVLGTPTYMAPEQCRGSGTIDARADLYALGCVFYEMLTGRPPFVADGMGELMAAHLTTVPDRVRVHAPWIGPVVDDIVMKLLAKSRDDRFASAKELLDALGGAAQDASGRPLALVTPIRLAAAQAPTTLSSAAGSVAAAPASGDAHRRRRRVGVAALLAVTVATVLASVAVVHRGHDDRAASAGEPTPASAPPQPTTAQSPPTPPVGVAVDAAPAPAAASPDAAMVPDPASVASPISTPTPRPPPAPEIATPSHRHPGKTRTDRHPTPLPPPPDKPALPPELPPEL